MIQKEHLCQAIICRENDTVLEASRILRDTQHRHLVVLNAKDEPVGIISTTDVNNRVVAEEKDPKKMNAKDVMTKTIETVSIDETYEKAFQKMTKRGAISIPVVRNKKLLGILEFGTAFKCKEVRR